MEVTIGRAEQRQLREIRAVAGRAFWDDPLFNAFQPDPLRQHHLLPGYVAWLFEDCHRLGEVWAATIDGRIAGAAAWLPPGVAPVTNGVRAARAARHLLPVVARATRRRDALKLLDAVTAAHPHDDHWYLGILVTDPRWQGRGIGTRLMQPVLDRADADGYPVYLETQKESNLAYYRRARFEVSQVVQLPGCPTIWTMTRPAP